MKNICLIGLINPMPEASNVYSNMDGGHEFDPMGSQRLVVFIFL